MKNTACIIILLSLLIAAISSVALAQNQSENQTIDVIGTGRIYGEDISSARDQAISDCLVTAISLVAADLLQQQVLIQSFRDMNRLLFSSADKYVQGYKVLTEDTTGRVYRVMVQATVSVEKIRELLIQNDILSRNTTPLKVLLLIAEQDLGDVFYRYWWGEADSESVSEAPLSGSLVEPGFGVVDHSRPWPVAADSDTLLETPPDPDINDSKAAGDSGSLTETPPGPEMSNSQAAAISEAPLAGALVKQGFVVVDHSRSWPVAGDSDTLVEAPPDPDINDSQATGDSGSLTETPPGPEMSNSQAAALGARFQADVVVVGTATVKKASNVLGDELRSFEGTLSVRAIRTDTGFVLADISRKFLTADADDLSGGHRALTEAGAQTGELLAGEILTAWQQTAEKGPIAATVVVEGNYQLSHLVSFRRVLSGMPGVNGLQTRGMTPKETILSLDYEGTAQGLAEALLLNSFEGFGVHITETTPDAIRLSLVLD